MSSYNYELHCLQSISHCDRTMLNLLHSIHKQLRAVFSDVIYALKISKCFESLKVFFISGFFDEEDLLHTVVFPIYIVSINGPIVHYVRDSG